MKRILATVILFLAPFALAAPHTTLAAFQGGVAGVNLAWTASATPGSTVNVYRCAGVSCTAFSKLTTGVAAAGPYVDTTATAGAYSYYVTAVVSGVESVPSNTATVTIAPLPPTGLTAK